MDCCTSIAFVDLQGFVVNKQFVPKEICYSIIPSCRNNIGNVPRFHYLYESPFSWTFLSDEAKIKSIWRSVFRHGIYWNDGCVPSSRVDGTVDLLRSSNLIIYVKGEKKARFLAELLKTNRLNIRNIEDFGANFSLEDFTPDHKSCGAHKHNTRLCAVQSVHLIENWYLQNVRLQEADRQRNPSSGI